MLTAALVSALVAAVVSAVACGIARRIALGHGAVVPPRPDRWHQEPTPTLGGAGIVAAVVLVLAAVQVMPGATLTRPHETAVPVAALAMFVIGFLDDRLQLSPLAKLVSSLVVGALLVFAVGQSEAGGLPSGATLVAVLWFGGIVHAVNLLDNMDGLAAGVSLAAAAFLAALFPAALGPPLVLYLSVVAGAALGFLYWNRNPARLFMGDAGSLFFGASLAGASLVPVTTPGADVPVAMLLVALVLVVPLFDTGFVLVLRRLAGRKATRGGTDHVSHRLVSLGFSERSAVRILYLLALTGGGVAALVSAQGLQGMAPLAALFVVGVALLGLYLARVPAYESEDFLALQKSTFAPFLKDLTFRWHAGQVLLDLVLITACYYAAYRIRFEGEALENFFPYFTASLPVVLGVKLVALYLSGLYSRSWDSFTLVDVAAVLRGVLSGSVLAIFSVAYLYRFQGFSRAVFIIDAVLLLLAVAGTRASFRAMGDVAHIRRKQRARRVLIYGAGSAGQLLVREMRVNPAWTMRPVAFVDDDPGKRKQRVLGLPVRGGLAEIGEIVQHDRIDEVVLSSTKIDPAREAAVREVCDRLALPLRRLYLDIR
ncbi:MAG: hypothetical protein AB7O67_04120 [Vicinamibacterales bacterium]